MDFFTQLLLYTLVAINIFVIIKIFIGRLSVFSPISIFSLTVISQMFPQLYILLKMEQQIDLKILFFMMCTSQLAFFLGYKIPQRNQSKRIIVQTIDFGRYKVKFFIFLFSLFGLIPLIYYGSMESVYGGINVILGFFRTLGALALTLCLINLENKNIKSKKFLLLFIFISFCPLLYYGYFVKGSRQVLFLLFFVVLYFLSKYYIKWRYIFSLLFIVLMMVGAFFAASMTEIRRINNYHEENAIELEEIDYVENFEKSFEKEEIYGWDLGNAAYMIDYLSKTNKFDYGASLWNGFIFNFFPQRYFGERLKESLYLAVDKDVKFYEDYVKGGITTTTGYYAVYKSFSLLGFLVFFMFGLFFRFLSNQAYNSSFFYMIFILSITYIPTMITHHIQYMLAFWEFVFIILAPIFFFFLKHKKIYYVNG